MNFQRLVEIAADLQCFSARMVSAGDRVDQIRLQLNRWVRNGKVIRIHKGWYALAGPFCRVELDPFVIACTMKAGTYVSLESALSHHGVIPEHVPETTCVTTGRPQLIETPVGRIRYRHMKRECFWGFREEPGSIQSAFVACAEKALLDLIYLTSGAANRRYINELRLENLEELDQNTLESMARRFNRPKLIEVPAMVAALRIETEGKSL